LSKVKILKYFVLIAFAFLSCKITTASADQPQRAAQEVIVFPSCNADLCEVQTLKRAKLGSSSAVATLCNSLFIGVGLPKPDYAEAYFWCGVGLKNYGYTDLGRLQTLAASKLTSKDRAALDKRVSDWQPGRRSDEPSQGEMLKSEMERYPEAFQSPGSITAQKQLADYYQSLGLNTSASDYYVEAYFWLGVASARDNRYARERNLLAEKLTIGQRVEVERRVAEWFRAHPASVTAPPSAEP
jgi:hypothetical protein